MVKLSERLNAVADLISPGLIVCDIGCDHAYLPIYLMQHKIAKAVIATDVNEGPLYKAAENIRMFDLSDVIDLRLCYGLKLIDESEAQCIVMAGMGGNLMIDIINESKDVFFAASEVILQPQSDISRVRHYLEDNGFLIISESMVYEDYKYYQMMKAKKGEMNWDKEIEFIYGKVLLHEQNPVLHQFLIQERDYYVNLYDELCCLPATDNVIMRLREVEKSLEYNNEALKEITRKNPAEIDRVLV